MITHLCDRCGKPIDSRENRYLVRIEVLAAADPLEITAEDLAQDHSEEMDQLLGECEKLSEEELMRDVYVRLEFDLCRACQKVYLSNPLATGM